MSAISCRRGSQPCTHTRLKRLRVQRDRCTRTRQLGLDAESEAGRLVLAHTTNFRAARNCPNAAKTSSSGITVPTTSKPARVTYTFQNVLFVGMSTCRALQTQIKSVEAQSAIMSYVPRVLSLLSRQDTSELLFETGMKQGTNGGCKQLLRCVLYLGGHNHRQELGPHNRSLRRGAGLEEDERKNGPNSGLGACSPSVLASPDTVSILPLNSASQYQS